jgi:uncharacterized membrane protein
MPSKKKIRTIFLVIAAATELMIGFASASYLKIDSLSFFFVIVTALIATGSIEHFVLNHDTDVME